jgi:hypothetical protein
MQRNVLILAIFFSSIILACKDPIENTAMEAPGYFNTSQHHDQWDNQLHPVLLQYYASLQSLREQDSTSLFASSTMILTSLDTLMTQLIVDTVGKKAFIESLQSLRDEYSALPMENNWTSIQMQLNMITRDWIYLLGSVGYQKTPVYITSEDDLFWLSMEKSSYSPYSKNTSKKTASYLLQELPKN